jgi:arylsulfatase
VAEGKLPRTIPLQISLGEGMDIGMDVGSPIDFTYQLPFKFTGRIEKVTVEIDGPTAKVSAAGAEAEAAEPAE